MTAGRYLQRPVPLIYARAAWFRLLIGLISRRHGLAALLAMFVLVVVGAAIVVASSIAAMAVAVAVVSAR